MSTTSATTRPPSPDRCATRAAPLPTSVDNGSPLRESIGSRHLRSAKIAAAQYPKAQEKLNSNGIIRILRSPPPVRAWVYRALLADNGLWHEWDRSAARPNMDQQARDAGGVHETESPRDAEAESVNGVHAKPHLTRMRLALGPYAVHFSHPGYIRDDTMRMLQRDVVQKTLEETRKSVEMREELGLSSGFWEALTDVFKAALPSLERRCFAAPDPAAPEYEGLSGPLIASYAPSLVRDLERLFQLVCIARNVLVHGSKVQDLAAERLFDKDIFGLINVCVRVTARGYDGEAGTQDEDKYQNVINAFKTLLITCLQFLNNLIARNEQRKLMLWIELFDSHFDNDFPNFADMKYKLDEFQQQEQPLQPDEPDSTRRPSRSLDTFKIPQQPASSPFLLYIGETGNDVKKALQQQGVKAGANEIAAECRRRWRTMGEEEKNNWNILYDDVYGRYRDQMIQSTTYNKVLDQHAKNEESVQALAKSINQLQVKLDRMYSSIATSTDSTSQKQNASSPSEAKQTARPVADDLLPDPSIKRSSPAGEIDFRVTYPPSFGAEILQNGKEDLLKRLEPDPDRPSGLISDVASPTSPPPDDDDDNDDDYDDIPGDEGRGLLTDVPLILGPTEIEVLPMIIMAGIVMPQEGQPGYHSDPTVSDSVWGMHRLRCHLLLTQDNGRNLLRELLIFVAAWDLREEELYFKFMVKIMQAILANQLLPFAYHGFREPESKDIITPAQAVIMKLLTNIFRARQARAQPTKTPPKPNPPEVYQGDVHMVNFLLTEFRRHIIPQTCALIFLQGQIRAGHAHAEDFPLNLWDMERMYEGVYQYLEFFAILTEHETWKRMLSNWEIANELVTLLKELDAAIPKGNLSVPPLKSTNQPAPTPPQQQQFENDNGSLQHPQPQLPPPVAVERPYDTTAAAAESYIPPSTSPSPRPYIDEAADEPSDFEWRNLKKLAVLVLSSLVWKNKHVQDQIRPLGGIEAVLNCCSYDEHNPYIREHAIMCLRFLMEGNKENQDRIRALEKYTQEKSQSKGTSSNPEPTRPVNVRVPDEVLDQQGYETFMDNKGQVMLRKRQPPQAQTQPQKGKHKANFDPAMRDPKAFEDLVQQVMRDLPRVQGLGGERASEAEEALKKLDRGFDGGGKS